MMYIGCMTGTSADKYADFTAATFDPQGMPVTIQNQAIETPAQLLHHLQHISHHAVHPKERRTIERQFTDFLSDAYRTVIKAWRLSGPIILSPHGQTLSHQPLANPPYCDVLIDATRLAQALDLPVVTAHRQTCLPVSMAAPLAPVLIRQLFYSDQEHTVLLNGGGIANICILPKDKQEPIIGYDTGPGNAPLDILIQYLLKNHPASIPTDTIRQYAFDYQGQWARQGNCIPDLKKRLLQHEYFSRPYQQKSADKAAFGLTWILPYAHHEPWADVLATLTEVIAQSITDAIHTHIDSARVLTYGGIAHNTYLMEQIQANSSSSFLSMQDSGYDPDFFESLLMAYLGFCVHTQHPIDLTYCAREGYTRALAIPGYLITPSLAFP